MIDNRVWHHERKMYYNRENIFSVDTANNEVYVAYVCPDGELEWDDTLDMYELDLEAYTGRRDKSGTDIYECDIVQVKPGLVGEVVYSNKYACFEIVAPGSVSYSFAELADAGIDIDSMVVIGNIHENAELLEEK